MIIMFLSSSRSLSTYLYCYISNNYCNYTCNVFCTILNYSVFFNLSFSDSVYVNYKKLIITLLKGVTAHAHSFVAILQISKSGL